MTVRASRCLDSFDMTSGLSETALLRSELTQVLHAFFHALDERQYGFMLECFEPDGRWLRQGRWLQGRDAIGQALEARPLDQRIRHVITNSFVQEAGRDVARVQAYMTAYRHAGVASGEAAVIKGPLRFNRVGTLFRRHADAWLIAEQQLVTEFEFA